MIDSLWKRWGVSASGGGEGGGEGEHERQDPSRVGQAQRGGRHDFESEDYTRAPTQRLSRDGGCRSRFSEADWADRVKQRTRGFDTCAGAATSAATGAVPPGAAADEWTLGPARPVHELDTINRYDSKQHAFHFC